MQRMAEAMREKDFYQINKMERNKNIANAINAVSIGTFSLLFCRRFSGRVENFCAKRSHEDGCRSELIKIETFDVSRSHFADRRRQLSITF